MGSWQLVLNSIHTYLLTLDVLGRVLGAREYIFLTLLNSVRVKSLGFQNPPPPKDSTSSSNRLLSISEWPIILLPRTNLYFYIFFLPRHASWVCLYYSLGLSSSDLALVFNVPFTTWYPDTAESVYNPKTTFSLTVDPSYFCSWGLHFFLSFSFWSHLKLYVKSFPVFSTWCKNTRPWQSWGLEMETGVPESHGEVLTDQKHLALNCYHTLSHICEVSLAYPN